MANAMKKQFELKHKVEQGVPGSLQEYINHLRRGYSNADIIRKVASAASKAPGKWGFSSMDQIRQEVGDYISTGQAPGTWAGDTSGQLPGGSTGGGGGGSGGGGSGGGGGTGGTGDTATVPDANDYLNRFLGMELGRNTLDNDPEKGAIELQFKALEQGLAGRKAGVSLLQEEIGRLEEDPLMKALGEQAQGLLGAGDLFSDEDVSGMIAGSDARLSQSYGNQASSLATLLGGRNIGADSGVAQELQQALRFNALQEGAMNEQGIRMQTKQLNRSALADALRLGMGTAGFMQGQRAQLTGGLANILAGESLTSGFGNTASAMAATAAPKDGGGLGFGDVLSGVATVKVLASCIPEGVEIDVPGGTKRIEEIVPGDEVIGYRGEPVKVLQAHAYAENPATEFVAIWAERDDGEEGIVHCCLTHKIKGVPASEWEIEDRFNGVERSYDLLTEDEGYRINGVPVNSMIGEMALMVAEHVKGGDR